ncbi:MAG TPA: class I SAM-dependent methyltransferase [Polyangiaceae bacterium]|nr:class I SAM-dependent methyltransferase [Polyangiaceae bacterium]
MKRLTDYVVFNDEKLASKYSDAPIPMSVLYEAYFDGDLDVVGDLEDLLRDREQFVKYTITRQHLQWAVTNYVPDMAAHTRSQDEKLVREMYDRGTDFFQWFLGDSMVYTSGLFRGQGDTLEQAQSNQLQQIAGKLQLAQSDRLLDISCGWGALVTDFAKHYGVDATGITLAETQSEFGNRLIDKAGVKERARIVRQDYRDLPVDTKYDKIVCLEMIEHVGLKNLSSFCERVVEVLSDDGLVLLQWTGLRRALKPEDMIWGLFMSKYIFPGADAALPPSSMIKTLEKAGLEIHSVENLSGHYAATLSAWRRNWNRNKAAVLGAYGDRWFRIWNFFLAWSVLVAEQGNASCYQAVLNKNLKSFNRYRWDAISEAPGRLREEIVAPESTERRTAGAHELKKAQ